jgi:3-oxoacyl-[acyl-carrier-protein] synthase II
VSEGSSNRSAIVTGLGLLTPLARGADETWDALLAGRFISDHCFAAGESDHSNDPTPRVIRMARAVAAEAIADAGWPDSTDVAVIVGSSKGSIESWITPLQHIAFSPYITGGPSPAGLSDIAADLARGDALRLTYSGACASGLIALARAAMLIESGQTDRVLVVASEAGLHPLFVGSFKRLGVLAPPEIGCRPFDRARAGFLMSEAAAAICLEARAAEHVGASPNTPVSEPRATTRILPPTRINVAIDRYALAGDANHLTAADPSGRVLRHLINKVSDGHPVDLFHAHGTGTPVNDPIELAVIESAVEASDAGREMPPPCLYSHKGALGHSLGAAGLVSVVLSAIAHRHGRVPPNVRTTRPVDTNNVVLASTPVDRPVRRSVAVASGFGGATAAISLKTL